MTDLAINIAHLEDGRVVQVGEPSSWGVIQGRHEAWDWGLRMDQPQTTVMIDGSRVKFWRGRDTDPQGAVRDPAFRNLPKFPIGAIQINPKEVITMTKRSRRLNLDNRSRPATGEYKNFRAAQIVAKGENLRNGRGYRAVKAQDGSGAVIFRPAVASNKQRRVRVTL
jgi:hypothetical protein